MNLKEIAKAAKVSPSTVSLVLNDKGGVSPRTREHVATLLCENGYNINYHKPEVQQKSIRFLKYSRHSHLVNGNAGFVSAIIDAVEKETRLLGYNLVMTVFGENNISEVFDLVRNQPLCGIILLATEMEEADYAYLHDIPVPIVVVDNYMDFHSFNCVDMNNTESTFAAVRHLAGLGHPRIGYLYNKMPSSNCRARRAAYEAALRSLGIPYDPALVYPMHPTLSGSYEDTLNMLRQGVSFPSALVATNDSIALGAVKAFKESGIRVPGDVSVIGFDDIPFSAIADPPLTTMKVSCKDIGMWAVRLLCDRIDYPDSPVAKIQIGAQLIVRESTGPYRKNTTDE